MFHPRHLSPPPVGESSGNPLPKIPVRASRTRKHARYCIQVILIVTAGLSLNLALGQTPAAPADNPELSPEDKQVMQLLEELEKASEANPDSPAVQEIQRRLDAAMKKVEEKMTAEAQQGAAAPMPAQTPAPSPAPTIGPPQPTAVTPPPAPVPPRAPLNRATPVNPSAAPRVTTIPVPSPQARGPGALPGLREPNAPAANLDGDNLRPEDLGVDMNDNTPVQLNIKNDMLDLAWLLDYVGKELKLNFLYPTPGGVTGQVKLQQFGELRRRDLLPLLKSILSFQNFAMVREGAFIRIVPKDQATKQSQPPLAIGDEAPITPDGDSVVVQIVPLKYASANEIIAFLANFSSSAPQPAGNNYLIITEYSSRLPRLLDLIALVDQPGPPRRLEVLQANFVTITEVLPKLTELFTNLQQQRSGGAPPIPAPAPIPGRPGVASRMVTAGGADGPKLTADERTNRLLVIGTQEQIDIIRQLLSLLDVEQPGATIRVAPYTIENVLAGDIAQQLSDLTQAINQQQGETAAGNTPTPGQPQPAGGGVPGVNPATRSRYGNSRQRGGLMQMGAGGPFILADERTNRIIVVGNEDQVKQIEELLQLLDIQSLDYARGRIGVYTLLYVEATEALKVLDRLGITQPAEMSARDRSRSGSYGNQYGSQYGSQYNPGMYGGAYSQPQYARPGYPNQGVTGETMGLPSEETFQVRAVVQESTNRIFVLASEPQHQQIQDIIKYVDEKPDESMNQIQIYALQNRDPEDVAKMLEDLLESTRERQVAGKTETEILPGVENAPKIVAMKAINSIAVHASAKQHERIADIIKKLDKRLPSVLLKAILVQVSADDAFKLGVQLQDVFSVGNYSISGRSPFGLTAPSTPPATGGGVVGGSGGTLAFFGDDLVFATLEALANKTNAKVMSMPRIMVIDNEEGVIKSEREQPTTKTTIPPGSDTPIVDFSQYVSAGTTLTITPHISEGKFLQLKIDLQVNSFAGESVASQVPPPRITNNVKTVVTVPDDATIILGGLTTENNSSSVNKVPILGDIPIIGTLFRNTSRTANKSVLYIFVKANIVRSPDDDFSDMERLSETYRMKLRQMEAGYEDEPIIPGVKETKKTRPSVLDEE